MVRSYIAKYMSLPSAHLIIITPATLILVYYSTIIPEIIASLFFGVVFLCYSLKQMFIHMDSVADTKRNSRQKIINTALELFSRQGFEKTSVREITKAAGISLGLMYNYFSGKEELLKAIIQDGIHEIQQSFTREPGETNPLALLVKQYFSSIEKMKDHWRLLHSIRMQQHLSQLLAKETEILNNYIIGELSLILQNMRYEHPIHEAVLLFAAIDGIAGHYLINHHYPLNKMVDLLISKYVYQ